VNPNDPLEGAGPEASTAAFVGMLACGLILLVMLTA
jgi:hypothetical protein